MIFIKANRTGVLRIHMQPNPVRVGSLRRLLDPVQQLAPDSLPSGGKGNFQGLDIRGGSLSLPHPLDNSETRQLSVLLGNPGGGFAAIDKLPHIPAPETKRRLEARLLDGIEGDKV